jgi:hypothetical protein
LKFPLFKYAVVKIYDSTTAAVPQNGVANDMQYIQCAIIEFLVVEIESVINIHKHVFCVNGSARVDRSTVCHWAKKSDSF